MKTTVRIFTVIAMACLSAHARVPPPSETTCEVVMSGRTITLKSIKIVAVGQEIPETYSTTVKNTPGMSWYVSQHYALKTDHDEATARRYLAYSELAYPFHVWILGRHPENQDRLRMPLVMGSSLEKTLDTILCDGGWRPGPGDICGGITYWGLNTAYNWPSGTLQYHQRDLVMHENLHLMMMCCGAAGPPGRLMEGITYTSCNHVYNEEKQQLTLAVFDKPTINMPTTGQLLAVRKDYMTFRDLCEKNQHICLFTDFMWSDPERLMKWRLWRDAMLWDGRAGEDIKVMEEIFGPLDGRIEKEWKAWLAARNGTFSYRDWGWEQSGDTLIAYGWPQQGPYSRTDILLPPGEKPEYDPLRMDYPVEPMSPLVGPVRRGVNEPSVGALISFARCPGRGAGGIGLGVQADRPTSELSYLPLLIQGGNALVIQGKDLGMPDETVQLPENLRQAMAAGGHQAGLTAKIRKDSLEVTLRARDTNSSRAVEFVKSWPITAAQRERLLSCPGTVLARDGYQAITPYFDDARRPESADLSAQAPGNRWRFAGEEETYRLYRAMSKLKDDAPASLRELAGTMARAMDSDEKTRRTAMKQYAARWPRVAQDVQGLKSAAADEALAELTGVNLEFAVDTSASNQLALNATVRSSLHGVNGRIALSAASARLLGGTPDAETVTVKAGDTRKAQWRWDVQSGASDVAEITATAALQCGGFTMSVKRTREVSLRQSVPCWYVMGPFDNPGGAEADIAHAPEKEPFSPAASYPGIGTNGPVTWRRCVRGADLGVGSDFVVDFNSLYGPASNVAGYAVTWVDSPVETNAVLAVGSEDGFIAWVNGERVGGVLKPARSYASRGDRVPIHLKQGENEIRLKITLSQYGWKFGAHVIGSDGNPAPVKYVLKG